MFLKRRGGEEGDESKEENLCIISELPNNRGSRANFSRENKEKRKSEPYSKEEAGKIDQEVHDSINHDDVMSWSVLNADTGKKRAVTDTTNKKYGEENDITEEIRSRKAEKDKKGTTKNKKWTRDIRSKEMAKMWGVDKKG